MIYDTILMLFASLGFSMIMGTKRRHYITCAILGSVSFCISSQLLEITDSILITSVISSAISSIASQTIARTAKAPATIFLLPSILPLVPGRRFFYAISSALAQNNDNAVVYFMQTIEYTAGISTGIMLGSSLCKIVLAVKAE